MRRRILPVLLLILTAACSPGNIDPPELETDLDRRVWDFLQNKRGGWDMENVPAEDGRLLYDLIMENGYTSALDIGTSNGHSALWMAWALSKTGGRLITVEIDGRRHKQAIDNFEKAGLIHIIDARHADAHRLVPELEGPFDFVFCDADKDWYINYLDAILPKLQEGGCFTAHNVESWAHAPAGFMTHVEQIEELETTVAGSSTGVSISYKRSASSP